MKRLLQLVETFYCHLTGLLQLRGLAQPFEPSAAVVEGALEETIDPRLPRLRARSFYEEGRRGATAIDRTHCAIRGA
jgi:hypothetical protein